MSDSNNFPFECMSSLKNTLENEIFLIFNVASQAITAQIGNLNHASELAINKQRSFRNAPNFSPDGTILVELAHKFRVLLCNSLIIVVN